MGSKKSYGFEANAAAIRAKIYTNIIPEKINMYKELVFDTFRIKGSDSYRKLLNLLNERGAIEHLLEQIIDRVDSDEFLRFFTVFLGVNPVKSDLRVTDEDTKILIDLFGPDNEYDLNVNSCEEQKVENHIISKKEHHLKVLSHEIKERKLKDTQVISYLESLHEPIQEIKKDIDYSDFLQVLLEIIESNDTISKTMLVCDKKWVALLLCQYLVCCYNEGIKYKGEFNLNDILIIVHASQIDRFYNDNKIGSVTLLNGCSDIEPIYAPNECVPIWMKHKDLSLVVIIDGQTFLSPGFVNKLKALGEIHRNIIVIYEQEKEEQKNELMGPEKSFKSNLNKIAQDISFELGYKVYEINSPDITSDYLKKVMHDAADKFNYKISDDVNLEDVLRKLQKNRGDRYEGNASILKMIQKAISYKNRDYGVLKREDFTFLENTFFASKNKKKEVSIIKESESAIERMNKHIYGLENVKKAISETVDVLKINLLREKAGLKTSDINKVFLFSGPPGVGKSEMANYFTEILFENGLLTGKRFISINAAELKAPYVGQTAHRVTGIFNNYDAIFLDECYSLAAEHNGSVDSFSQEALAQLCVELEKHGKDKLIILAGYGGDVNEENNKIKQFINANPGIASRVTFHINFPRYLPDKEMPEIFKRIVRNADFELEEGWRNIVVAFFKERFKKDSYGNGREARRLFQQAIAVQATRLANKEVDKYELSLITCEDIKIAASRILSSGITSEGKTKRTIGFRS